MKREKLSDFIRANIGPILEAWEQFAKNIPSAVHMNTATLRDHASGMLYAIADHLDYAQTPEHQSEKSKGHAPHNANETHAQLHGTDRLLEGFNINETVSEFHALRASVIHLWNESNPEKLGHHSDERRIFNEAIDQALAESLARYSVGRERDAHLFDTLLSSSPDLSYIFNIDGRFIYANLSMARLYQREPSEMIGKSFFDIGAANAVELQTRLQQVVHTKVIYQGELPCTLATGKKMTYEYYFVPVLSAEGKVEAIAGTARDITVHKESEAKITRSANYDGLTDLPNRNLFQAQLEREIKRAERTGLSFALLFIDLDGFKSVNDRLGHAVGDLLLQQVAQRISVFVRGTDMVARLGGDEFTVIFTEVNKIRHIEILTQKILEALARPFSILENDVNISGSIGITLFPQDASTAEDLLRNADQAMYAAKKDGSNRFNFFTAGMQESAWIRLKMLDELRHALARHQLSVYYQPIVDLSTEAIVKAEALLRWHHPQDGLMLPSEFIGLAEETGLICEIDEWVLGQAVACARKWSTLRGTPFQISVNKSPVEFMNKSPMQFMDTLDSQLTALGVARNNISVEITEGVLLNDSPIVREKLVELQKAGVQLAIDDFGRGYSSMAYLKKFHVHCLKIDQSFVQDMTTSMDSRTIAETIIVMAHKLGLKVIAEGVETVEQSDWLKTAECDYAQGFLFSPPVSSQDFEKLLNTRKYRSNYESKNTVDARH